MNNDTREFKKPSFAQEDIIFLPKSLQYNDFIMKLDAFYNKKNREVYFAGKQINSIFLMKLAAFMAEVFSEKNPDKEAISTPENNLVFIDLMVEEAKKDISEFMNKSTEAIRNEVEKPRGNA